ncbi:MAG: restriction endonuclease subunit S [Bacteroidales bacterium]
MLKGQKIVNVLISESLRTADFRLEAEFYNADRLNSFNFFLGEEILEMAQYNSAYGLNNEGIGYPILRMNEFEGIFTGVPKMFFDKISKDKFEELKLKKNDILICRTNGNPKLIGKSAIVPQDSPFIYESHLFKIRVNEKLTNAATVITFLNTKYGRREIDKFSMVGNQANFSIAKFKELRIPKFSNALSLVIEKTISLSFSLLNESRENYAKAEALLLKTLGLESFQRSTDSINIKGFRESFVTTGRLDAEYYQKKFEQIIEHIESQHHSRLSEIVTINKSIEPGSESYSKTGLPFLRVSDYDKFGISRPEKYLSDRYCEENRESLEILKPKAETILFSKDGSVGIAYMLVKAEEMITSGAILHLRVKSKNEV